MLMKLVKIQILSLCLFLSSCGTTRNDQSSKIYFLYQNEVNSNYEFVGIVEGSSILTGVSKGKGYKNALNEMCENSIKIGATHVVLSEDSGPKYWTTSQTASGKAYKCKSGYSPYLNLSLDERMEREYIIPPNDWKSRKKDIQTNGASERLKSLQELKDSGMISELEYIKKRQSIIDGL